MVVWLSLLVSFWLRKQPNKFYTIFCVWAPYGSVSATKAVRCLWLVNWNSYEPAQPITEADSLGRRQSVYISTHIAQTTNVVTRSWFSLVVAFSVIVKSSRIIWSSIGHSALAGGWLSCPVSALSLTWTLSQFPSDHHHRIHRHQWARVACQWCPRVTCQWCHASHMPVMSPCRSLIPPVCVCWQREDTVCQVMGGEVTETTGVQWAQYLLACLHSS